MLKAKRGRPLLWFYLSHALKGQNIEDGSSQNLGRVVSEIKKELELDIKGV